jgi:hypothetical protein
MRSAIFVSVLACCLAGLTGCTNPNSIGVQTYGTVTVHCVRASDGSPVPNALIRVSSLAGSTKSDGSVTISQIPTGAETFVAQATGLAGSQTANVVEGANPDVTIQMQPAN